MLSDLPTFYHCGSRMTGDCHVRFCERVVVQFLHSTHPDAV